jgi:two-component system sensor histidine kinase TctE
VPLRSFLNRIFRHQTSLFGAILVWMLAPLLILGPISMAIMYSLAYAVSNAAYDRDMSDGVTVLARHLKVSDGRLMLDFREVAREILMADELSEVAFQVREAKAAVVDGDPDLPAAEYQSELEPGKVYYRDDQLRGREVRIAYLFIQVPRLAGLQQVQLAETREKRRELANSIIGGIFSSQFILLPLALVLVYFGLAKGIEPLEEMRRTIVSRKPTDLSSIDRTEAPEELRPFIDSINGLMQRLVQGMKAQQRFVADAAHQMKTPLAGLKTQAELALRQRDLQGIEHTMRQIALSADRASRLVNQLLSLARTEGEALPPMQRLDMVDLVRETTREWVERAIGKNIDLGFESAHDTVPADGNSLLLHELLSNLLDNALRYTPEGGKVTTRVFTTQNSIAVEVEDNGIGVSPADRELVFERFFRVLGTGGDGSGLGLSIVREIAALHRGRVSYSPAPAGQGSIFRIDFPLWREGVTASV